VLQVLPAGKDKSHMTPRNNRKPLRVQGQGNKNYKSLSGNIFVWLEVGGFPTRPVSGLSEAESAYCVNTAETAAKAVFYV
jgi:hypothetical protein